MPKSTMDLLDQKQPIAISRWRSLPPKSWIGTGQNQKIAPGDLEHVLGSDAIGLLAQHIGLSRSELLAGLSEHLPELSTSSHRMDGCPPSRRLAGWFDKRRERQTRDCGWGAWGLARAPR
jgi:hypothetical protein